MTQAALFDPKGLMKEAFAIEGIQAPECRSIFLDWALSLPSGRDTSQEVERLVAHYEALFPDGHPMLETLNAALEAPRKPRRRGGRQARVKH